MYFTGFDCLGCPAAYPPDQDLLLCPQCPGLLAGYEAMVAEAERIG